MPVVRVSATMREPCPSLEQISGRAPANGRSVCAQTGHDNTLKMLGPLQSALFAQTENRGGKGDKYDRHSHNPMGPLFAPVAKCADSLGNSGQKEARHCLTSEAVLVSGAPFLEECPDNRPRELMIIMLLISNLNTTWPIICDKRLLCSDGKFSLPQRRQSVRHSFKSRLRSGLFSSGIPRELSRWSRTH